jgi:dihydrofolate reductase
MSVKLIVAMCKNNGIGFDNKIPWRISEDMSYFSKKTSGDYSVDGIKKNAVIMGRNTWESLPKKYKPLPNRFNIVLTRNTKRLQELDHYDTDKKDIEYASSLDDAIELCYGGGEKGENGENSINKIQNESIVNDIWIIGGSSLYREFIDYDPKLSLRNNIGISSYYITYIDKEYNCDTYFPMLENMNKYHLAQFEKHECIDKNTPNTPPLNVYYIVFKKIKYTHDKLLEELFTPYRNDKSKKNTGRTLLFYVKKTRIDIFDNNNNNNNNKDNDHEILFSMFCS